MYRTFVILRHTFLEAIVQPIYPLLLAIGAGILAVFAMLPFFTLGEDTAMFKSVALDVILLLVLISTLFATSKSIYEEIEDRTMLTLMSKPVSKWEVLVGKYLGIVCAAGVQVLILGGILVLCTWWRIPGDYMMNTRTLDDRELQQILDTRLMHIAGLIPGAGADVVSDRRAGSDQRGAVRAILASGEPADGDPALYRRQSLAISLPAGAGPDGQERVAGAEAGLSDEPRAAVSGGV